jgi:hypothetical protein
MNSGSNSKNKNENNGGSNASVDALMMDSSLSHWRKKKRNFAPHVS